MHRRAGIVAGAAILLFLSACGKGHESGQPAKRAAPQAGGTATYDIRDANGQPARLAVTGPGGTVTGPAFAPIYPGAQVQQSVNGTSGSGAGGLVIFRTEATPDEVIAFYRQKAASAALGNVISSQAGKGQSFTAGKEGSEQGLQVTATPDQGETYVVLTWTDPKRG